MRPARMAILAVILLSGAAGMRAATVGEWKPILRASGADPGLLSRLPDDLELATVALAPDGTRIALAYRPEGAGRRAMVRLLDTLESGETDLAMPGEVRALAFDRGSTLYALMHRPARKREGDSYLARIDVDTLRARRELRVPSSCYALEVGVDGKTLFVGCMDELRTYELPDLRTGPLFVIEGDNRVVRHVGGTRVLLGQVARLVAVDLNDRPDEEGVPLRAVRPLPSPAVWLAVERGASGRVIAENGDTLAFDFGSALAPVARPEPPVATETQEPPAGPSPPETAATPEVRPRTIPAEPAEPEPPEPLPVAVEAAEAAVPAREPATPEPEPEPEAPPEPEPPSASAAAVPDDAQLVGRVTGPIAHRVVAVIVLGPDNLLREARRIEPDTNGWWHASGLEPGRYRIQVDGGGDVVLVSDPPFLTVTVTGQGRVSAPPIRVLRTL